MFTIGIASIRTGAEDLHYRYDSGGRLIEVVGSLSGSLHRYGYQSESDSRLTVALSTNGDQRSYPDDIPITGDLGRAADFGGNPVIADLETGEQHQ